MRNQNSFFPTIKICSPYVSIILCEWCEHHFIFTVIFRLLLKHTCSSKKPFLYHFRGNSSCYMFSALYLNLFEGIKACVFGQNELAIYYPPFQKYLLGVFTSVSLVRLTSVAFSLKTSLEIVLNGINIFQLTPLWWINFQNSN